jgi:hypothetical protein
MTATQTEKTLTPEQQLAQKRAMAQGFICHQTMYGVPDPLPLEKAAKNWEIRETRREKIAAEVPKIKEAIRSNLKA